MSSIYGLGFEGDGSKKYSQKELANLAAKQKRVRLEEMLADLGFSDNTSYCQPAWIIDMCEKLLDTGWIKE